jgi:hypothetical protein
MKNEVIAISISVFSLAVSALSLGWNIYRDAVQKPRLRLSFGVKSIHHSTLEKPLQKIVLSAVNFGPRPVYCQMIHARTSSWWRRLFRKTKHAVVMADSKETLSGRLPSKLEVGEGIDLLLPYTNDCLLGEDFTHIGLMDSFGRFHWAPCKDVKAARKEYRRDFVESRHAVGRAGPGNE